MSTQKFEKLTPNPSKTGSVQSAEIESKKEEVPQAESQQVETPKTAKVAVSSPEKTKPRQKKKQSSATQIGIKTKQGSAYSVIYRLLSEMSNFDFSEKQLDDLDTSDQGSCRQLLRNIMVERGALEGRIRSDEEFQAYCDRKTAELQEWMESGGDKAEKAKKILANPRRAADGKWIGDIREMLSVCTGSSSRNADNRNTAKYAEAQVAFRQFPRSPRRNRTAYIMMVRAKHLQKLNAAIEKVFGREEDKGFAAFLEKRLQEVFG